jgi:hypothetical protein
MADKKTRKEINAVILKYLGENNPKTLRNTGIISGGALAVGTGIDLFLTGGLFSTGMLVFGALGGAAGVMSGSFLLAENRKKSRTNTAAQSFECTAQVDGALKEMEYRLRKSFARASAKTAGQEQKENFLRLAAEIEADVKKLSPAFKIVSGGPHGAGADKYEFILGDKGRLTLAQALHKINQPPADENLSLYEKKMKHLDALIEELENTPHIKRDKNRRNPPK